MFIRYILVFLFLLNSANTLATTSYRLLPEKFTVVQTLLPDNTVEFWSCSYSDVGTPEELEYCTLQLTDMNLTIHDFSFANSNDANLKILMSLAVTVTGSAVTAFAIPLSVALAGTALTFSGAFLTLNTTFHHIGGYKLEKSIHRKSLVAEKSLVFVFETEEERIKFLSRVRSAVKRVRNPYRHQPLQPSNYP